MGAYLTHLALSTGKDKQVTVFSIYVSVLSICISNMYLGHSACRKL
jgi:hypothetical protein